MIIDTLSNADQYAGLHPNLSKAFQYINSLDSNSLEDGKYEIEGDALRAIVSNKEGMTVAESIAKFECHNKYIDIQLVIKGIEQFGWKARGICTAQKGEYNLEKDVLFYSDAPDIFFKLTDSQFAIFYPEDVHAPMIGEGPIKKLVVKVKI